MSQNVGQRCIRCVKDMGSDAPIVIYAGTTTISHRCEDCLVTVLVAGEPSVRPAQQTVMQINHRMVCMDCSNQVSDYLEFCSINKNFHYVGCVHCWEGRIERGTRATLASTTPFIPGVSLSPLSYYLIGRAARYVQLCLEGGDWDIIDTHRATSENLLKDIRKHLGLTETYDFTAKTRKDDA